MPHELDPVTPLAFLEDAATRDEPARAEARLSKHWQLKIALNGVNAEGLGATNDRGSGP